MTYYDTIVPLSLGTGVAKTSVGTKTKPSDVQQLIEFTPYLAPSGAVTAGESMFAEFALESTSISLIPKRVVGIPICSGLGATFANMIPILEAYECNTPLIKGATPTIEFFGQAQVANTVAPVAGVELHWSDAPPVKPELFYTKPDNETSSGTAATTVAGGTVTINGGSMLKKLYALLVPGTVLASESYIGSILFTSDDYVKAGPNEIAVQPIAASLSTLIGTMIPKLSVRNNVDRPIKSSFLLSTTLRLSEALTNAGNFIGGVGYVK